MPLTGEFQESEENSEDSDQNARPSKTNGRRSRHRNHRHVERVAARRCRSDTAITTSKMPTGFENSALKMSFSLSSLQPSSGNLEGTEHVKMRAERPYNSLTKKSRRDPEQESWRHSWGSREVNKDEFWAALQHNYDYIMDNNLIDSCKEASGELSWDDQDVAPALTWSFNEFINQFSEIYSWLNSIQEAVYGKEDSVMDQNLRTSHLEEMRRNCYRRKVFNDQARKLLSRYPDVRDEVSWRVAHLNTKWDMLEQAISPCKNKSDKMDQYASVEHEVKCLRKWVREMEGHLEPLDFRVVQRWSHPEIEEKARQLSVLLRGIKSHGKIVTSVVRLCEKAAAAAAATSAASDDEGGASSGTAACGRTGRSRSAGSAWRVARTLERRWHHLYLRALEWQCHVEELLNSRNPSPSGVSSESDEEPVSKHPRLTGAGDTSDEGSYFEDDLEELCVMESNVDKCENLQPSPAHPQNTESDFNMVGASGSVCRPTSLTRDGFATSEDCSNFNRSNWLANNIGTFYFKHMDTDSDQDKEKIKSDVSPGISRISVNDAKSQEESSEDDEWTYTPGSIPSRQRNRKSDCSSNMSEVTVRKSSAAVKLDFGSSSSEGTSSSGKKNLEPSAEETKNTELSTSPLRRKSKEQLVKRALGRIEPEKLQSDKKTSGKPMHTQRVFEPLLLDPFSDPLVRAQAKSARTKEWLRLHAQGLATDKMQLMDSCDASGEYTTGDSEAEKESVSSEDQNGSVSTCRKGSSLPGCESRSVSTDVLLDPETTPVAEKAPALPSLSPEQSGTKVVMRTKRRQNHGERPWSVSGITQLAKTAAQSGKNEPLAQFSISESAINKMATTPPAAKVGSNGAVHGNLSSSTIDEVSVKAAEGSGSRTSSLRRRRMRLRRRTGGRKSESGSDSLSTTQRPISRMFGSSLLVKSGSFSGVGSRSAVGSTERNTASDPSTLAHAGNSTSASGTEDDSRLQLPVFRLGPLTLPADSDIDRGSAQGTEEQLSSFSEQAWDNYQEKYLSEPYSEEPADPETARRLLEFGDDYRNFLDSQSDCSLSRSASNGTSSLRHRRPPGPADDSSVFDSDSDLEDFNHAIYLSQAQLEYVEMVISEHMSKHADLVLAPSLAHIVSTCSENISALSVVLEKEHGILPEKRLKELRGWLDRWQQLYSTAEELQRVRCLQREMVTMREEMMDLANRVTNISSELKDRSQLDGVIQKVKVELTSLLDRKADLLRFNVAVHRYHTDTGHPARLLKDDVAELYRVWDDIVQRVTQQLAVLQRAAQTWQQFDTNMTELQGLLCNDRMTLHMLDAALRGGQLQPEVARVLSEKQEALCQSSMLMESNKGSASEGVAVAAAATPTPTAVAPAAVAGAGAVTAPACLLSTLAEHGSLSDSGISDSGSEHELCERERRLATLRSLARHLMAVLPAGSHALLTVSKQIEQAEAMLRGLQRSCRALLVQTGAAPPDAKPLADSTDAGLGPDVDAEDSAAPAVLPLPLADAQRADQSPAKRRTAAASRRKKHRGGACKGDGGDPEAAPSGVRPWLWRVLRASLPFHVTIMLLFCVAYLLEPRCCDSMNTMQMSFTPQLRYVRGPPPI
ncbi:klarsicht protein [Schistocerca nitens]|uniref:klarsicht protein n=1 Tax=Schistocerca nitens TaxID=7011 RepID=UPI0021190E8A|nr:klarsicht protein [Schistocerca nitens]